MDSNIIIYSNQPGYDSLIAWLKQPGVTFSVSAISQVEVLGYHKLADGDREDFSDFFSNTQTISITSDVIQLAIRLRQQRKRSLGDAIIAATALIHNLPVVTHNTADFLSIDGLTVISLESILTGE
ncbi:type II toxin-antitoxin system VapC family toxin [Fibrella sp. HMF5335]|uniref:Type II toxin-antitoxin system VapC family toxin n=1 Tax=Fibrella rubiginis TaxID=2817060 RepID=A0A939K698_9BACT|nr:type II toxin-antitoxin system VapC family toxin [Fibrella rubiginis]MBO0938618.1 type II toxin-antitoxin system VapC family toxin [Fibrella rubiginis]